MTWPEPRRPAVDVPLPVLQEVCRRASNNLGQEWTPDQVAAAWDRFVAAVRPVLVRDGYDCPEDAGEFRAWLSQRQHLVHEILGYVRLVAQCQRRTES